MICDLLMYKINARTMDLFRRGKPRSGGYIDEALAMDNCLALACSENHVNVEWFNAQSIYTEPMGEVPTWT